MGGSWGSLAEFLGVGAVCILPGLQGRRELTSACGSRRGNQCPPLEPRIAVEIHASPWSSFWCCPVAWERCPVARGRSSYASSTLLFMCLPIMVVCLSGRPKLHNIPLVVIADLVGLFPYLSLGLSLGLSSGVCTSAPNPHLH